MWQRNGSHNRSIWDSIGLYCTWGQCNDDRNQGRRRRYESLYPCQVAGNIHWLLELLDEPEAGVHDDDGVLAARAEGRGQ